MGLDNIDWMNLVQKRAQFLSRVNTVMRFCVALKGTEMNPPTGLHGITAHKTTA
jgi:hypothetical protein